MRSLLTFRAATNERNEFGDGVSEGGGRANKEARSQGESEGEGEMTLVTALAFEVHDVIS